MHITRFTFFMSLAFVIMGVLGFIPGFLQEPHIEDPLMAADGSYSRLFGLFPVNWLHNLVHLESGDLGIERIS